MYDFIDIRLSTRMLCALVGRHMHKIVLFSDEPTSIFWEEAFLYIDRSVYALNCEDDRVTNDTADLCVEEVRGDMVRSHLSPPSPRWETPVGEPIEQITRVDECHRVGDRLLYMTRGLIFRTATRDVCFCKETPRFSASVSVGVGERGSLDVPPLAVTYKGDYDLEDAVGLNDDSEITVVRERVAIGSALEAIEASGLSLLEKVRERDKVVRTLCGGSPDEIRAVGACPWCGRPIAYSFTTFPFGSDEPDAPSRKLNVSCDCTSSERFFSGGARPNCASDA